MNKKVDNLVSLVCATIGNPEKTEFLVHSLINQTYKNWELIIVDQSDDCINKKLEDLDPRIQVIHSNKKGLSYNRNIGLTQIAGCIIGFPDDDCFYEPNVLMEVAANTESGIISILSRKLFLSDVNYRRINVALFKLIPLSWKIYRSAISYNIFLHTKSDLTNKIKFNEDFGIGSKFGACEESFLIFELLQIGYLVRFCNDVFIWHPDKRDTSDRNPDRIGNYAKGFGAFCKFLLSSNYYLLGMLLFLMGLKNSMLGALGDKLSEVKSSNFWYGFREYKKIQ
jgi:glycosyltransferase involved in cell wall biosynthesis